MSTKTRVSFDANVLFYATCNEFDFEDLQKFVKLGVDINYKNFDGLTALHSACINGNIQMCKFLIENGANVDCKDSEGWTPLHIASSTDDIELSKLLINSGASLSIINYDMLFPFELCCNSEMIELLTDKMNELGIDRCMIKDNEHAMMLKDARQFLLKGSAENFIDPQSGATALHVAAAKNYIDVLEILLKLRIDVNQADFDGWTALHTAAYFDNENVCKLLIEAGANLNARSKLQQTPKDMASDDLLNFINTLEEHTTSFNSDYMPEKLNLSVLSSDYDSSYEHIPEKDNIHILSSIVDSANANSSTIPISDEIPQDTILMTTINNNSIKDLSVNDESHKHEVNQQEVHETLSLPQSSQALPTKKKKKDSKSISLRRSTTGIDLKQISDSMNLMEEVQTNEKVREIQDAKRKDDLPDENQFTYSTEKKKNLSNPNESVKDQIDLSSQKTTDEPSLQEFDSKNSTQIEKNPVEYLNEPNFITNSIPYRIRNSLPSKVENYNKDVNLCKNCPKLYTELILARIENSELHKNIDCLNLENLITCKNSSFNEESLQSMVTSLKKMCQLEIDNQILLEKYLEFKQKQNSEK